MKPKFSEGDIIYNLKGFEISYPDSLYSIGQTVKDTKTGYTWKITGKYVQVGSVKQEFKSWGYNVNCLSHRLPNSTYVLSEKDVRPLTKLERVLK